MNHRNNLACLRALRTLAAVVFCTARLAPAVASDAADLARAAQNPIASMISVPFQYNANLDTGPQGRTQSVLNIQPVVPFALDAGWNLVTRTILPLVSMPGPGMERTNGLGDVQRASRR